MDQAQENKGHSLQVTDLELLLEAKLVTNLTTHCHPSKRIKSFKSGCSAEVVKYHEDVLGRELPKADTCAGQRTCTFAADMQLQQVSCLWTSSNPLRLLCLQPLQRKELKLLTAQNHAGIVPKNFVLIYNFQTAKESRR